jgi:hypothetical protein
MPGTGRFAGDSRHRFGPRDWATRSEITSDPTTKSACLQALLKTGATGLEPATSGVTGRVRHDGSRQRFAPNGLVCRRFSSRAHGTSAWLSQPSARRLGHEWATESCLYGQRRAGAPSSPAHLRDNCASRRGLNLRALALHRNEPRIQRPPLRPPRQRRAPPGQSFVSGRLVSYSGVARCAPGRLGRPVAEAGVVAGRGGPDPRSRPPSPSPRQPARAAGRSPRPGCR